MFIQTWKNTIFLLVAAYGSYVTLKSHPYIAHAWQYYFYLICPWVLLFGSIGAFHRFYSWRRMSEQKNHSPLLSRGHHQPTRSKQRPGIFEYVCLTLFFMAVAAILKQLGVLNISWWIGSVLGACFLMHLAIKVVR